MMAAVLPTSLKGIQSIKAIRLSDYFQLIRPEYVYLQVTPATSIRNYNSDKIAKAVHAMYKKASKKVHRQGFKWTVEAPVKMGFYVYLEKSRASFYFVIPKLYLPLFKEKIADTWQRITIKQVEQADVPVFNEGSGFYLTYTREDPMSLAVDKRTNTLLGSSLAVLEVMEQGDRLGIFYNFAPVSQFGWRAEHDQTTSKIEAGQPVDRSKFNLSFGFKMAIMGLVELTKIFNEFLSDLFGSKDLSLAEALKINLTGMEYREWSAATSAKKERTVISTQIAVLSQSKDPEREINNAVAVCEGFKSISEDNELTYKPFKITRTVNFENARIRKVGSFKASVDECQNFIALPGRELLEEHGCIDKVDTFESEVPEELQHGVMGIGKNTFKGKVTSAFLTEDREYRNLTTCIIGPTRAGKTTFFQNVTKSAIDNGECVVIPDFISWCKFSHEVGEVIPKSKQLIIDCEDFKNLPGFGFNELWRKDADPIDRYDSAKNQTAQLLILVDGINAADKNLSAKMDRYLESAALVVFAQYGAMKDVFETLRNHNVRRRYVEGVPTDLRIYLQEYADSLLELDDRDKEGNVTGTRLNAVAGILDRVSRLKRNTAMEIMLKKGCEENPNLLEELQKPQLIVIRMPDSRFSTEPEKDFMCTYWFSKLWLTLQLRDTLIKDRSKRVKVNIIWDELYQVPYTQALLRDKLSQIAKFDGKSWISCHYLSQIGIIRDELKAANSSYMLLQGCDKDNFKELKSELYPYQEEDLLKLKRYHSLNLLRYEGGWAKFITKLPGPVG